MAASTIDRTSGAGRHPWLDHLARIGFAARGVVWIIIGVLAAKVAMGNPEEESADRQGALAVVAEQPFGKLVLIAVALGTAGYALWRFSDAVWGHTSEDDEKTRAFKRLSSAGKGVLYAFFCFTAISFVAQSGKAEAQGSDGSASEHGWTAKVLEWPGGRWLVGVAGVAVIGAGAAMIWRGVTQKFEKKLETGRMGPTVRRAAETLGTVGTAARGVVFALAGLLLISAARDFDPSEAQGIDGTLRTVADRSYGQVLLMITAAGLVMFGAYSFVEARYRNLHR